MMTQRSLSLQILSFLADLAYPPLPFPRGRGAGGARVLNKVPKRKLHFFFKKQGILPKNKLVSMLHVNLTF